jgi:hypothetical protein
MGKLKAGEVTLTQVASFKGARHVLQTLLEYHLTEARRYEDAMGLPTRIRPKVEVVGIDKRKKAAKSFRKPRGSITAKVWQHLIEHPGLTMAELRSALEMDEIQLATAINSLLRKRGQITAVGERGSYQYYAVKAEE